MKAPRMAISGLNRRWAGLLGLVLALNLLLLVHPSVVRSFVDDELGDFGAFIHSGKAAREGLNPYAYHEAIEPKPTRPDGLNLNPPISVVAFDLLARIDLGLAWGIIQGASLAALSVLLFLLRRRFGASVLTLAAVVSAPLEWPVVWQTVAIGQIYLLLGLLSFGAWLALERGRLTLAGILIGVLASFKPTFLLWPAILMVSGHRPAGAMAVATTALIGIVPLAIYGPVIYSQWLDVPVWDGVVAYWPAQNVALSAMAGNLAWGMALGGIAAAVTIVWCAWSRPAAMKSSAVALIVALLVGPVSWPHYFLIALPAVFFVARGWALITVLTLLVLGLPGFAALVLVGQVILAFRRSTITSVQMSEIYAPVPVPVTPA